jgi:hypothetical protein
MKRLIIAGAAGITLFLVASIYLVDRITGLPPVVVDPARAGAVAPRPFVPGGDDPGAAPPGADLPAGLAGVGLQEAPVVVDPSPPPPPKGSWEAVPMSARAGSMGPAGRALGQELNDLHPSLSACFDEDSQARHGSSTVTVAGDADMQASAGNPVLVLELETLSQAIRIVDAPVEARGGASDGLLACAQRKLRGLVIEAPGTLPGQRHRLQYALQQ